MRDFDWKILSTLYRTKNITKTADLLFITQPTLTRRLQQIEAELGTTLILRTNKGVSFTPEGTLAALKSAEILAAIEDIKSSLSKTSDGLTGTLRLGAPNSYVHFVIPRLMEIFSHRYPNVQIEIHTNLSHELLHDLEAKELDVSFVRGDITTALEKRLLSKDQIYIISKRPLHIHDLPQIPQIAYTKETSIIKATERWWNERFTEPPRIHFRVHSGDACLQMVKHDLGYGIFSDSHYYTPQDNLIAIPLEYLDGSKFIRKSWVVYDKNDLHNPLLSHFLDFVDEMQPEIWPSHTALLK